MRRVRVVSGVAVAIGLATCGSATAATLEVRETFGQPTVTYLAEPGERNQVRMTASRRGAEWRIQVHQIGPMSLGEGCLPNDGGAVCVTSELPAVGADLGDKSDDFEGRDLAVGGQTVDRAVVRGGTGADEISVISAYSCPDGQDGDDTIRLFDYRGSIAGHGSCVVFGGSGDDHVVGSDRDDFIQGGLGRDVLEGRAGSDELDGGDDSDRLTGEEGDDELSPGQGADHARGGKGNDNITVVYPRPARPDGIDRLQGGVGSDAALYLCGGCEIRLDQAFNDGLPGETDLLKVESVTVTNRVVEDEVATVYGPGHDRLTGGPATVALAKTRPSST